MEDNDGNRTKGWSNQAGFYIGRIPVVKYPPLFRFDNKFKIHRIFSATVKGQKISKAIYGILNIFQKMNEKQKKNWPEEEL